MGLRSTGLGITLGAALASAAAQTALACAFHGYTPNPTLVDVLLSTEQIAVVRPRGDGYDPVRTLAGPPLDTVPIDIGAEAAIRLKTRPDATVLIARDGAYGPWVEIAVMDARYRSMVGEVIQRAPEWQLGEERSRLAFFAARLTDPDADVRYLALRELDRAPYGMLRDLRLPEMPDLRADLDRGDPTLLPIRVLLAGLSGDRSLADPIAAGLAVAARNDIPYVGAYATALIELEGAAGAERIVAAHLRPGNLSAVTAERLLEALALQQKTGEAPLRAAISRQVAALLRDRPELAGAAARQFGYGARFRAGETAPADRVER